MTTWKDGGNYGRFSHEIVNDDGRAICTVWIKQEVMGIRNDTEPWPEGEANFRLILQAPKMLEALESMLQAMNETLGRISYQETVVSQLGDDVFRQVVSAMALAQTTIAAVKGENDETELV